jgi:two-component system, sensor histidine kinase YesM
MMKAYPLQKKLTIFYVLTLLIPVIIISLFMPIYYQYLLQKETNKLTGNTLTALTYNIGLYLEELEGVTILPYFNDNLMKALKIKTGNYDDQDLSTKISTEKTLANSFPGYYQNVREEIVGTVLLPTGGSVYVGNYTSSAEIENFPFKKQDWYKEALATDGKAAFIRPHVQDYLTHPSASEVFSVARLIKDPETMRPLGVLMADADTILLKRLMNEIHFNVDSIRVILDEHGEVFYASSPISKEMLEQINQHKATVKSSKDSYSIVSKQINPTEWKMVVLLSKAQINEKIRWVYLSSTLFAFVGLLSTIFLFLILSKWIVKPFKKMIAVMRKIQQGNMQVRLNTKGNDEISELGKAFNSMLDQINELIDREYKAVLNQRNAEYRALQSQIQPHFLFNTLNGFFALNRMEDRKKLEKGILSLSSMLRYSLGQEDWTTIKDAFQFLEQYCGLQQLRFQDRMEVQIQYDESALDLKIPKLSLQPLVENAIIHGIEPSDNLCKLLIKANIEKDHGEPYLVITIRDNGVGFDSQHPIKKSSIGISNVQERLKMAFPTSIFLIESKIGSGTTVNIKIPLKDVER